MVHLEQLVHCLYVSQKQLLNEMTCDLGICTPVAPYGPGAIASCLFTSPPSTLSFSIFYFSPLPFLTRFICFLAFRSLPLLPE